MKQPIDRVPPEHRPKTMLDVQTAIAERQRVISDHAFLRALAGSGNLESMRRVAPRVAFFVMCFQDVLRLVHARSSHPQVKPLAEAHAIEDSQHDMWYLRDIERLGVSCDIQWLFSQEHQLTRDVAYVQIAEVIRAEHDQTRLAVALSLEALAAVFFDGAKRFLERIGEADELDYFGGRHLRAEQAHDLFEVEGQDRLAAIVVSDEVMPEVFTAIDRVFESMTTLATDLERAFLSAYARVTR